MTTTLSIAFLAGLISFLSPCVLPLIPGYISYISGQTLHDIYGGDDLSNDQVSIVLEIMARSKVLEYAKSLADLHAQEALNELSLMDIDLEARSEARELIHFLLERDH
mgnify:CR=1 FL=1